MKIFPATILNPAKSKTGPVTAALVIALYLAIALQIQVSLFANGTDYLGLRVSMGDFVLPFAGLCVLSSLLMKKTRWPVWRLEGTFIWLGALTAIMGYALINGYLATGVWDSWALVNKFTGWLILSAYLCLGGWLGTNYKDTAAGIFVRTFALFFAGTLITLTGAMLVNHSGMVDAAILPDYPLAGLMANRNAYAFLMVCAFTLITLTHIQGKTAIPVWMGYAVWLCLPLALYYNGSRAGFFACVFLLVFFLIYKFKPAARLILPALTAGCVILFAIISFAPPAYITENHAGRAAQIVHTALEQSGDLHEITDSNSNMYRLRTAVDALSYWKDSPLTGIGLGTYLSRIKDKYTKDIDINIIDATPLWLLTETGLIGLAAFLAFYTLVIRSLRASREEDSRNTVLRFAVIIMLLAFGLMSLAHELLYTRFLWVFMGIALSKSDAQTQASNKVL